MFQYNNSVLAAKSETHADPRFVTTPTQNRNIMFQASHYIRCKVQESISDLKNLDRAKFLRK